MRCVTGGVCTAGTVSPVTIAMEGWTLNATSCCSLARGLDQSKKIGSGPSAPTLCLMGHMMRSWSGTTGSKPGGSLICHSETVATSTDGTFSGGPSPGFTGPHPKLLCSRDLSSWSETELNCAALEQSSRWQAISVCRDISGPCGGTVGRIQGHRGICRGRVGSELGPSEPWLYLTASLTVGVTAKRDSAGERSVNVHFVFGLSSWCERDLQLYERFPSMDASPGVEGLHATGRNHANKALD